jgi:hypothetical protein
VESGEDSMLVYVVDWQRGIAEFRYNGTEKQILKDASVMREKAGPVGKERRILDAYAGVFERLKNSAFL